MCGHGTIGTITAAIESGLVQPKVPGKIRMEAPAGLVSIDYSMNGNKVSSVKLTNVAGYLDQSALPVECPGLGEITVDVAYGGNFYAIVDLQPNFAGLENFSADQLISMARQLRKNINAKIFVCSPGGSNHQWLQSHTLVRCGDRSNIDGKKCGFLWR